MRSRTATWFECKIRYEKTMEDGLPKKVSEVYVVDALSFSEAEERIIEEMSSYISGEIEIVDVKIAPYREIFFADDNLADQWFKAKLSFITIDERTDKEKRTSMMCLVNADNISSAINNIGAWYIANSNVNYNYLDFDPAVFEKGKGFNSGYTYDYGSSGEMHTM